MISTIMGWEGWEGVSTSNMLNRKYTVMNEANMARGFLKIMKVDMIVRECYNA